MRRMAWIAAAGLAAAQVRGASFSSKQISSSATWVVHADLESLRQTQLGEFLVGKLDAGDAAKNLAAFAAVFGFDPRKDLSTLTLYGKSKDPAQSVVLAGAKFNETQLVTSLKANDTYQSLTFGRYTLHSWIDANKVAEGRKYGAFHPTGLILMSRGREMLQEALEVLDGDRDPLDASRVFGTELQIQAPFFMAGANMAGRPDMDPSATLLKQADSGQLSLGEKDGNMVLNVTLTAKDASVATNMCMAAQGMQAMAQLGQEKNPDLAQMAQATHIRQDGRTVRLDLVYPVARVIVFLDEAMNKRAAAAAAGTQPPISRPAAPQTP